MLLLRACRWPVAVSVLLVAALALLLPLFSGPDELGHLAYVAAFAQGHLPIVPHGAWAELRTGTTWQAQHPPLFYLLATPLYLAANHHPSLALLLIRFAGALVMGATVALAYGLAHELLLSPSRALAVAWIVALHPTLLYIAANANNEMLSTALGLGCLWAAAAAGRAWRQAQGKRTSSWKRLLLLCIVLGGLALLTKLTAVAAVAGAAWLAGSGRPWRGRLCVAAAVVGGSLLLWLPWGALMYRQHGQLVPSSFSRPAFDGGLWAIAAFPFDAAKLFVISGGEFCAGLFWPYWLQQGSCVNSVFYTQCGLTCPDCWGMQGGFALCLAGLAAAHWLTPRLRFVALGLTAAFALIFAQEVARDGQTVFFASRYTPLCAVLATLIAVEIVSRWPSKARWGMAALWLAWCCYGLGATVSFMRHHSGPGS